VAAKILLYLWHTELLKLLLMRIAFFSNSRLGLPAFESLARQGLIAGLCVPNVSDDDKDRLRMLAQQFSIPKLEASKESFDADVQSWLRDIQADVAFVLTWPFKISSEALAIPQYGFCNFHFARLPQYRGAEPLFWELANREANGAVTIHQMDDGWDTGPVLLEKPVPISPNDTHGMHLTKLSLLAPAMALDLVNALKAGTLTPTPQNEAEAKYYDKPGFNELRINWQQQSSAEIIALVRAGNPWNRGAFSTLRQVPLRVTEVSVSNNNKINVPIGSGPGTVVTDKKQSVFGVLCSDQKVLSVDVLSTEDGVLPGLRMFELGIRAGERFE